MINSPGAISIYPQFDRLAEKKISISSTFFAPNESQNVKKRAEKDHFFKRNRPLKIFRTTGANRPSVP